MDVAEFKDVRNGLHIRYGVHPGKADMFSRKEVDLAGVTFKHNVVLNYLDTGIAMVEAGEGIAVVPSFIIPACRNRRVVMSKLTNPVVNVDFSRISLRGKKLPPGADDFTSFLQSYIARWAGRAGIL